MVAMEKIRVLVSRAEIESPFTATTTEVVPGEGERRIGAR
jgi:hypothetical protein